MQVDFITILLLLSLSLSLSYNNHIKHRDRLKGFILKPTLLVQTSESFTDNAKKTAFLKDCSSTVAKILSKPEQYVMISYKHSDGMMYAGTEDPCGFCHLASIGEIGPDTNPKLSAELCKILSKHLNIPSNRVYIQFYDSAASNFGYDSSTFG